MKWFNLNEINTLEDLKKAYKRLVFKHHPDKGGDTEDMKEINAEYDSLLKRSWSRAKASSETAEPETDARSGEDFRDVINKIVTVECDIEIIGTWIWATGNTYPYKDILKAAGFKWCSKKRAWAWHRPEDASTSRSRKSLDEIRAKYGSEKVIVAKSGVYIAA